ncbi:hypothetical protein DWQ65_00280 [Treponema phagedenis]|nr:hypothetical protein HMPREF9554_00955 [Treponema phagedenis F0421]QSH98528.1 hypothetical protein DWQ65_00280 [Treponema phagedenis]
MLNRQAIIVNAPIIMGVNYKLLHKTMGKKREDAASLFFINRVCFKQTVHAFDKMDRVFQFAA